MATVKNSITIDAPVEKVFEYVKQPENLPEFWPSMLEVSNIKELPTGGYRFEWVYKMAGMRFKGASEVTEFIPNERTVTHTSGGIESTITWEYSPLESGTKVNITGEYKVPLPLVGKLAESFIVKQNEQESQVILANLKARMEA
ncbi:MAG: SRPBCC family protein [Anaerolineales bacterium]|jgi:uncharacterized membrane protein